MLNVLDGAGVEDTHPLSGDAHSELTAQMTIIIHRL